MLMVLWLVSCLEGSGADKSSGKYPQVFSDCRSLLWSFYLTLFVHLFGTFLSVQNRKPCMCSLVLCFKIDTDSKLVFTCFISASGKVALVEMLCWSMTVFKTYFYTKI